MSNAARITFFFCIAFATAIDGSHNYQTNHVVSNTKPDRIPNRIANHVGTNHFSHRGTNAISIHIAEPDNEFFKGLHEKLRLRA